jgi:flagellar hook-associated protein 3 FlgL
MRVSFNSAYDRFLVNNSNTQEGLNEISKQLSSGKKIQFGHESPSVFIDTLRLENEITTFNQTKDTSNKAKMFSDNTDSVLNEFGTNLDTFKTKLLAAANNIQSNESNEALVKDLKAIREHLLNLANTSINGQFIFSGSAISKKPVNSDGSYNGNSESLNAKVGSQVELSYNLDGNSLLFGKDIGFQKTLTTNVKHYNLNELYPQVMQGLQDTNNLSKEVFIKGSNTIRDLVGDNDQNTTNQSSTFFYVRGTKTDGTTFKEKFSLSQSDTLDSLTQKIEAIYGNSATNSLVNVKLNEWGQIEITDKTNGRNLIDFHMVAATDLSGASNADVNDISKLSGLTVQDAIDASGGSLKNYNGVLITSFIKSGSDALNLDGTKDNVGTSYDKVLFSKNASYLKSNVSQVTISGNNFASSQTKISEVAGDLTGKSTSFSYSGKDITGANLTGTINLSTLTGDTPNKSINEVTYQQLMNEIAKAVSKTNDITEARKKVDVYLDEKGKINIRDLTNSNTTKMDFSLYDTSTDSFGSNLNSTLTFHANNALTVDEPSSNFFAQLDEAIKSVNLMLYRADGDEPQAGRSAGVQNAITSIEHLMKHVENVHTKVGTQSRGLEYSIQRQETLIVNAKTLQSDVLDTDVAETNLKLQQLSLNYQAMMSTIVRVNQLSLMNYMK